MRAWKRTKGSPQPEAERREGRALTDDLRSSLRSAMEGGASPFLVFGADGRVIHHLAPGWTWLPVPADTLPLEGERLSIPPEHTLLRVGGGPPEGVGDDDSHADPPLDAGHLPSPCAERRTLTVSFLEAKLSDFILTGQSAFPEIGGATMVDWMTILYMFSYDLPNASVGVVDGNGRLKHARGYTNLGRSAYEPVISSDSEVAELPAYFVACPNTLYRIASLTKPITAMAIQRMIRDEPRDRFGNKITIESSFRFAVTDDVYLRILPLVEIPATIPVYRDVGAIRLVDLLVHQAGWCEGDLDCSTPTWDTGHQGISIMLDDFTIVNDWKVAGLSGPEIPLARHDIVDYAFSSVGFAAHNGPFKWHNAAESYAYSNFGYALLGRVLEYVTGATDWTGWYDALRQLVLDPLGMRHTLPAGASAADAYIGEAPYVVGTDNRGLKRFSDDFSVLAKLSPDSGPVLVSAAYGGGKRVDYLDTAAGLVSTVVDYCRFLTDQRLYDTPFETANDITGRLWTVLTREEVYAVRRVDLSSVAGRSRAWALDSSKVGHYLTQTAYDEGLAHKAVVFGSQHRGSLPGTAASAYLFPPIVGDMCSNVGIAAFSNSDVPHPNTVADGRDNSTAPMLSSVVATILNQMPSSSWNSGVDYFPTAM